MRLQQLIDEYAAGPERLRQAVAGMSEAQLDAAPIPGRWSTRQVVSHIADFELVYADRMKRVVAMNEPELLSIEDLITSLYTLDRKPNSGAVLRRFRPNLGGYLILDA
jgi:uncharacterized damage-inducible protein DinB